MWKCHISTLCKQRVMQGTPQHSTLAPFSVGRIREALVDAGSVCASPPRWASFFIKILSSLFLRMGESPAGRALTASRPADVTAVRAGQNPKGERGKINLLFLKLNSPKCS